MEADRSRLGELARLFLRLGTVGFGGPVVHLALFEEEIVRRRRWMSADEFLDLLGLTNLIPGPNSTEMTMAVGYRRAGLPGLIVSGLCFLLPAAGLTAFLAWAYLRYGSLPALAPLRAGLGPAVVVVMVLGLWRLGRAALTRPADAVVGAFVMALALMGVDEVLLLFGAALAGAVAGGRVALLVAALVVPAGVAASAVGAGAPLVSPSLTAIAAFFLQIGAVLYGGGYVLIALLQSAVDPHGWLTQQQLVDAVAAGQVTPGPVLTTATFVGYLLGGVPGAAVATAAVFLPAFVFTAVLGPHTNRIRRSRWLRRAVRTVSVAAVAVMAAVTVELAREVIGSPAAAVPMAAAAVVAWRGRSTPWVLLAGMLGSAAVAVPGRWI